MMAIADNAVEPAAEAIDLDAPMDVKAAAKYLLVEPDTLHKWRCNLKGPHRNGPHCTGPKCKGPHPNGPLFSILGTDGRTVRYTMRDLIAFMNFNKAK
jgi:hypothetical protein